MEEVKPSPNSQNHPITVLPGAMERSVNCVESCTQTEPTWNMATGFGFTWIHFEVSAAQVVVLVTWSDTRKLPTPVKVCGGFWRVDVFWVPEDGSPKYQSHEVIVP